MTISSSSRKAGPFIGNGSASVFAFSFRVFAASDLEVVRIATATGVQTTLTINSGYTVSLNADQNSNPGGSITLVGGALASGQNLIITSNIANLQPTDLTNQGGFYPEVITDALDRATIQIQQVDEHVNRTLAYPITDPSLGVELPAVAQRKGTVLAFNATTGAPEAGPTIAAIGTVSGNTSDINTVAANIASVNTTAGSIASVNTVAGSIAAVSTVSGINASVTAVAAIDAEVVIAANNVADITNFADVYQGGKASDPTLRNDGSALQTGDLYYNTANNRMRVYETGTGWIDYEATAQTAATTATTQAGIATSQAATATTQATTATTQAAVATSARTAAETARDVAQVAGDIYATTAAGIAAKAVGQYFSVPAPGSLEYLILYRVDAGPVATEIKRYPSADALLSVSGNQDGVPSYTNAGGTGDRTSSITVTISPTLTADNNANLVDGGLANNATDSVAFNAITVTDLFIRFDFGQNAYRMITEATWRQGTTSTHGTWKWQGSFDGVTWTDIGASFTLGGATAQVQTTLADNRRGYRFYQLLGISGTASGNPWVQEVEFKIAKAVTDGLAKWTDVVANTLDATGKLQMPANVVSYYPCDEGLGTTLRDIIGGRTASINNGGGTVEWTVEGWLRLINGWFKLPSQLTQTVVMLFRAPEGHGGYYFAAPNQDALGDSFYGGSAATVRSLHGWGISEIPRQSNGAGPAQMFSGGWCMISHQMASASTNITAVGCGNHTGAGAITSMEVAGIAILSGAATDAQLRQILNYAASRNRDRGIFLTPWYCPRQAHLAVVIGESTSEGTFPLSSLSAGQRATFNEAVLIDARNNASSNTSGRIMKRLMLSAAAANNNPPTRSGDSGLEVGLLNAREERSNDGRPLHILKVANGSTYLVPSGSYTNAAGGTTAVNFTRNAAEATTSGMLYQLEIRNMRRMENIARNQGIGYATVSVIYNEGLNDAYIGTGAVPDAATYQGYVQAHYDKLEAMTGIGNLKMIAIKPHEPSGGLGGGDADYPNTAVGTNRLTALGYIRTAFDDFKTANTADVSLLDGNSYALNTPSDYVHPSAAGYDAMGRAAEALFAYTTAVVPRA